MSTRATYKFTAKDGYTPTTAVAKQMRMYSRNNMITKFIETVEAAERENKPALLIDIETATGAKDFIIIAQDARSKGGRIGGKLSKGGGRPRKYKNASERQKAYMERKKKS